MLKETKIVKFKLSSWKKLRREFYGRINETYSDYIERIAEKLRKKTFYLDTDNIEKVKEFKKKFEELVK